MHRGEDILLDHALVKHDGVLIVVTLPGHESHLEVASEGKFAVFSGISFGEDIAGLHALALVADWTKVDGCALVGFAPFGDAVFLYWFFERHELLLLRTVVADADGGCIDEFNDTVAFSHNLCTRIAHELTFDAGTYDRSLRTHQGHCLAHHVRSHECTVGVIVLQEGDQRSRDRGNLLGSHVHELHLIRCDDGEVGIQTCLHALVDEIAVVIEGGIALGNHLTLLNFGGEVGYMVVVEVHAAVGNGAVGGLDESEVVDLRINAKRRDQTDVRAFRGLDRAETAVMGVVYVSHLKACTLAAQTAGAEGRQTALVGDFGQRVCLVHELAQRVGTEECVDNRRYSLGVDEVDWCEHLVVAHIHAFADGSRHTGQTHAELIVELLANGAHTAVAQVVDIVYVGLRVDKFDEIFDNLDHVLLGEHLDIHRSGEAELFVDAVAAHFAQVITLFGEEEVGDNLAGACIVRRLGVAQLSVDVLDGLLFRVGGILLEGFENY